MVRPPIHWVDGAAIHPMSPIAGTRQDARDHPATCTASRVSGHLAIGEQPQDDAESDQADEPVLTEVTYQGHDVGYDVAEEREIGSHQQGTDDGEAEQHQTNVSQRAYPTLHRV